MKVKTIFQSREYLLPKLLLVVVSIIVIILLYKDYQVIKIEEEEKATQLMILNEELENERKSNEAKIEEEKEYILSLDGNEKYQKGYNIKLFTYSEHKLYNDNSYKEKSSWEEALVNNFNNGTTRGNLESINLAGNSFVWGWLTHPYTNENDKYDFFIVDLKMDENLSTQEYIVYYENMVNREIIKNPKVEIIIIYNNNTEKELSDSFLEAFNNINEIYHVNTIDVYEKDPIWIGNKVFSIITTDPTIDLIFDDVSGDTLSDEGKKVNDFVLNENVLDGKGNESEWIITLDKSSSILEYTIESEYIILSYLTFDKGGVLEVYIDNELLYSIDTKSDISSIQSISLYTKGQKEKNIIIKQKYDQSTSDFIQLIGVSCQREGYISVE